MGFADQSFDNSASRIYCDDMEESGVANVPVNFDDSAIGVDIVSAFQDGYSLVSGDKEWYYIPSQAETVTFTTCNQYTVNFDSIIDLFNSDHTVHLASTL